MVSNTVYQRRISSHRPDAALVRCSDCDASVDALAGLTLLTLFHAMLMRMRGAGGQLG